MRNLLSIGLLFCFLLSFTACSHNPGKADDVKVTIGESVDFSKDEIQKAVNAVTHKFRDFEDCELLSLWYDEQESDDEVQAYLLSGRGSVNGAKAENVIVLFSDFYAGENAEGGFNPDSDYEGWNWILIRDSKTSDWRVDDWGY